MKYTKLVSMSLLAAAVFFSACSKDEDDHNHDKKNDTTPPTINIIEPSASMFDAGDTVKIVVVVEDNVEMHEVDVFIHKKANNEEVFKLHRHSHSKTVNINSFWVIPGHTHHDDFVLTVKAEDAARNKAEKKHEFHAH